MWCFCAWYFCYHYLYWFDLTILIFPSAPFLILFWSYFYFYNIFFFTSVFFIFILVCFTSYLSHLYVMVKGLIINLNDSCLFTIMIINVLIPSNYLHFRLLFDTPNSSSLSLRRDYFKPKSEIHSTTGQVTHFYSIMSYFYCAVTIFTPSFQLYCISYMR